MRLLALWICLVAALPGCKHGAPSGPPIKLVTKHYSVEGYDAARDAILAAEHVLEAGQKGEAAEQLRRAIRIASYTLNRIEQDRNYGTFVAGQHFSTSRDGVLTEAELCRGLTGMRDGAEQKLATVAEPQR